MDFEDRINSIYQIFQELRLGIKLSKIETITWN